MGTGSKSAKRLVGVVAIVLLVGVVAGIWRRSPAPAPDVAAPSETSSTLRAAPDFTLKTVEGKEIRLSSYRGKAVYLHFWATWCPPCVHEIPEFLKFARSVRNQPVQFIAVSLDDNWAQAHRILKPEMLPANVASVLDIEAEVPDRYGSFQFPETYLITPDGRIQDKYVGAQAWDSHPIRMALEKAISAAGGSRP